MVTFTVHEPPHPPADRLDRAERLAFVKDGFSVSAAVLGPFWLLVNRLWIGLGIYVLGLVVLVGALSAADAAPIWFAIAVTSLHVLLGFEGSELERAQKDSDGWAPLGSVEGRSEAECERRFFDAWLPTQAVITRNGPPSAPGDLAMTTRPRAGLMRALARLGNRS